MAVNVDSRLLPKRDKKFYVIFATSATDLRFQVFIFYSISSHVLFIQIIKYKQPANLRQLQTKSFRELTGISTLIEYAISTSISQLSLRITSSFGELFSGGVNFSEFFSILDKFQCQL